MNCVHCLQVNFYGAPLLGKGGEQSTTEERSQRNGTDYVTQYNTYPDKGSTYRGRILIDQRIEDLDQLPKGFSALPSVPSYYLTF